MLSRGDENKSILRLVHIFFIIGLVALFIMVLRPFIVSLMWSVIFAILLYPLFKILELRLRNRSALAAFIITILGFMFLLIAVIPLFTHLGREALQVIKSLDELNKDDFELFGSRAESIPFVGSFVSSLFLDTFHSGSNIWSDSVKIFQGYYLEFAKRTIASIASILFGGFFTFLCLYFVLAYSSTLISQIKRGALIIGGPTYLDVISYVYATIRATLYGVLLTSLAQGSLAGVGYYLVSAPYPVTLTIITALASLVPFGPPFIYIPVAIGLVLQGVSMYKIVLFLCWCVGVVSAADNILRPLFISQTTKLSFLLVLFGILGGVSSFGMLGLFIGPIIMVVVMHFWNALLSRDKVAPT
jgi:predicted PurR-regulated permease PerM